MIHETLQRIHATRIETNHPVDVPGAGSVDLLNNPIDRRIGVLAQPLKLGAI
jgi:hypothetical protein